MRALQASVVDASTESVPSKQVPPANVTTVAAPVPASPEATESKKLDKALADAEANRSRLDQLVLAHSTLTRCWGEGEAKKLRERADSSTREATEDPGAAKGPERDYSQCAPIECDACGDSSQLPCKQNDADRCYIGARQYCFSRNVDVLGSTACSAAIFNEVSERYAAINAAQKVVAILAPADERTAKITRIRNKLAPRVGLMASSEANRQPHYGLFAGPSLVLQEDGGWNEGLEVLYRSVTEVFGAGDGAKDNWCLGDWCRGYFEASYTTGNKFENQGDPIPLNLFAEEDGRLRLRGGLLMHGNDWVGLEGALGVTSPLRDGGGFSRVEPHFRLGVHFQNLYSDGMLGQLSMGLAHDRYWQRLNFDADHGDGPDLCRRATATVPAEYSGCQTEDLFDRFYLDGMVLFPNLDLGGWRLAGRLSVDAPLNGNTEADVRGSVLLYYPFNDWLDSLKVGIPEAEAAAAQP